MKLFSLLLFSAVASATPSLIQPRQPNPVTIRAVNTTSGAGCQRGDFTPVVATDGQSIRITFKPNVFNVTNTPGQVNSKSCTLRIDINFPAGCSSLTMTGAYRGFGQYPTSSRSSLVNNYSMSSGTITENNPTHEMSGVAFVDGDPFAKLDSAISVRVNTANPAVVKFIVGINLIVAPPNAASPGFAFMDDAFYRITAQSRC